ncbi:DCC1-like thiol-disulfide oxidoreductase family protein [Reichenbachiella carrageenanivorans]|uniref:DCC1-like thiol-disulfide oxidoreductase family protein n=1 Tax=Reichenbachiella carrageenanivorans TaxID=2979869 RepID=A0ABY6CW21_9BACT|nr:DCC1-like thiol-disulfide oxidoreductase family protein [Reichenbachiella carrageenanivorans]UXX78068.1 DCC1-like thiol-disulfide oxidoreductase family protein [Reichenbachiella carrageenanivorans]
MDTNTQINPLVLYDGVCTFCNSSVNFILDHERNSSLHFAPLQSETGQAILKAHNLPLDYTDSLLYAVNGQLSTHAKAAFKIATYLKSPWRWVAGFGILPPFITNFFYNLVAKHRYKLMGQADACILPSPAVRGRFLD